MDRKQWIWSSIVETRNTNWIWYGNFFERQNLKDREGYGTIILRRILGKTGCGDVNNSEMHQVSVHISVVETVDSITFKFRQTVGQWVSQLVAAPVAGYVVAASYTSIRLNTRSVLWFLLNLPKERHSKFVPVRNQTPRHEDVSLA